MKHKITIIKKYFSMLELMMVLAIISAIFALTALLIDSTKTSVIEMSIQDHMATIGMDIMNGIKEDIAQSSIIFTPDSNGDNHYYDRLDFGTHPTAYGLQLLPYESTTMDIKNTSYDPDVAGNTIFFAKEFAPYNLSLNSLGLAIPNSASGNSGTPNDPPKKTATEKEQPATTPYDTTGQWYNRDGALVDGLDAHFNIKRFQFVIYYQTEIINAHKIPSSSGGTGVGYLNLARAETGLYADFNDIENLAEPERSNVIEALMLPTESGGANINTFWNRDVTDPDVETAFYTYARPGAGNPFVATPLPNHKLTIISSKNCIYITGSLSTGLYSIAYNNSPLSTRMSIPKYASSPADHPAGFEVLMSGNKQNRRVLVRLVTIANEHGAILSQENFILAQASEVSAASGIYYSIPTP